MHGIVQMLIIWAKERQVQMKHALGLAVLLVLPQAAFGGLAAVTKQAKAGSFDATAEVRCAQEVGEELRPCAAAVARDASAAAVVVTFPNGFKRTLTFENGAFLRGNTTMSGVGTDTDWQVRDGIYRIRVDDQQFEIPETLSAGG